MQQWKARRRLPLDEELLKALLTIFNQNWKMFLDKLSANVAVDFFDVQARVSMMTLDIVCFLLKIVNIKSYRYWYKVE